MSDKKSPSLGDISTHYARLLALAVRERCSPETYERWLKDLRLSAAQLDASEQRISIPHFMRLGEAAIRHCDDPNLGLHAAAHLRTADVGLAGLTAQCAPTLGAALDSVVRFERLLSQNHRGHSRFIIQPDGSAHLSFYSLEPYNRFNYFVVDMVLAGWAKLARLLTGQFELIDDVHIEYPDLGEGVHVEGYFGCRVRFGQSANQLIFSRAALALPVLTAHPGTYTQMLGLCEQALDRIERKQSLRERIRDLLGPRLKGKAPSLDAMAEAASMPPWTLRRRLQDEGMNYRDVLDELRAELAESYVRDTALTFAEISDLLGFANPAAFHRAFARWHQTSPGNFRRSTLQTRET